eukprot:144297-Amphidinium_carterae.1
MGLREGSSFTHPSRVVVAGGSPHRGLPAEAGQPDSGGLEPNSFGSGAVEDSSWLPAQRRSASLDSPAPWWRRGAMTYLFG